MKFHHKKKKYDLFMIILSNSSRLWLCTVEYGYLSIFSCDENGCVVLPCLKFPNSSRKSIKKIFTFKIFTFQNVKFEMSG